MQATASTFKASYFFPKYWGIWFFIILMRLSILLPFSWQIMCGKIIGNILLILLPSRKRIAATNIQLCFPDLEKTEINALLKKTFQNGGIAIFETAMAWWASDSRIRNLYELEGDEHIQAAIKKNQPILLLSGHFCSTELGGRFIKLSYSHFQAMYKPAKNKLYNALMCRYRSNQFDIVARKNSKQFIRNLKKGEMSWYAPDQNLSGEEHVFAPFFNVPTLTITATSRIAKITNATTIPFHPIRTGSRYKAIFSAPLEDFPSEDHKADAKKINASIEKGVLLDPAQYLWAHKRFHILPDGNKRQYT